MSVDDGIESARKGHKRTKRIIQLPSVPTSLAIVTGEDAPSPLFQIPNEVLLLIIENCIGNYDYAGIYCAGGLRIKPNMDLVQTFGDSTLALHRAGVWWALNPCEFPRPDNYRLLSALAMHWTKTCVPLMLSCRHMKRTVERTPRFDGMRHYTEAAFKEYHEGERCANFRKWFQERKTEVENLGHSVALTVRFRNDRVEDASDIAEKFPHVDMTDRKFYCAVTGPLFHSEYTNYLEAVKLTEHMNEECRPFLKENYRCSLCR